MCGADSVEIHELHGWEVTPAEARRLQDELRGRVQAQDRLRLDEVRTVAGVDNAYVRHAAGETAHAVAVLLSYPELELIETAHASARVTFPYVPGLLTFREAPAILEALRRLSHAPDVIMFDGQGRAHPRRFGLAAHLGVILDLPSIGVAKSRLTGRYQEPGEERGAASPLLVGAEEVGAVVRTQTGRAPLFISVGHGISLPTAVDLVLATARGHVLPEPTRLAHTLVTEEARAARTVKTS